MTQPETLTGVVHGKTIELKQSLGLPDGQEVTVTVQALAGNESLQPGEGIRRSAGAWSEDAKELDEYLDWNRRQRKMQRPGLET